MSLIYGTSYKDSSVILQVTVFQVILYPEFSSITAIRSWMTGSVSFLNDSLSTGILTPGKCAVLMLFETTICISYIQLCRCCVVKPRFHILGLGYTRMWPSSDHAMCHSNPAAIPRDCSGCILALKPTPAQRLSHSASLYEHPQTLADQATEPGRGLLFSQGVPVDPSGLVGWVEDLDPWNQFCWWVIFGQCMSMSWSLAQCMNTCSRQRMCALTIVPDLQAVENPPSSTENWYRLHRELSIRVQIWKCRWISCLWSCCNPFALRKRISENGLILFIGEVDVI